MMIFFLNVHQTIKKRRSLPEDALTTAMVENTETFLPIEDSFEIQENEPISEPVESPEEKRRKEFETKIQTIVGKLKNLASTADELKISSIARDAEKVYCKLCRTLNVPINHAMLSSVESETVDLSYQGLRDEDIIPVAKTLTLCKEARALELRCNRLGPKSLLAIAFLLDQNGNIARLNLSSNSIGRGSATFLRKLIAQCYSIEYLDLSNSDLGGDELQEICLSASKVDSIKELVLNTNDFGGATSFGAHLSKCGSLLKLDLSCCHLEEGASSLFTCLKTSNLTDLDLSRNGIPNESMPALATGLRSNKSLKNLNISYNAISNRGAAALAPGLKGATTLETFNLAHNPISGSAALALLSSVGGSLKVLDLTGIKVNLAFLKTFSSFSKTKKDVKVLFGADIRHDLRPRDAGAPREDELNALNAIPFLNRLASDKGLSLRNILKDMHAKFLSEQHAGQGEEMKSGEPQERPGMSIEELARGLAASPLAVQKAVALKVSELLSADGFVDAWSLISKVKWKPDDLFVNIKAPFVPPPPAKKEKKK